MTSEQITEAWAVHEGDDYLEVYVTTFTNNPTVYNVPHPSTEDRRRANVAAAAPEMLAALKGIKAEFQRLKDAVMERTDMPFIAKARDAGYLDGVIAVIDSKAGEVIAKIEGGAA